MRHLFLILLLFLTLPTQASGPSVRFEHYLGDDGLTQKKITSLLQDSRGFIWIGSNDGLLRFDGYGVKHYRHNADNPYSLSNNQIRVIIEDNSGDLWIGTQSGLNLFEPQNQKFTRYLHDADNDNSLSDNEISTLLEDQQGNLWIGTMAGGLNHYDRVKAQFSHYRHTVQNNNSLSHDRVYAMVEDNKGKLWIGTAEGGLNRLDPKTRQFRHYRHDAGNPASLSHDRIFAIIAGQQGNLWLGTEGGGLNRFDPGSGTFSHFLSEPLNPNSLSDNVINAISQDSRGNLWIGTWGGGLNRFDPTSEVFTRYLNNPTQSYSLSDNTILALINDKQDNLWIGTNKGGLSRLNHQIAAFNHYLPTAYSNNQAGLNHLMVSAFAQDGQGNLWVGTQGGGLNRIDGSTGRFSHFTHDPADPHSLASNTISALAFDQQNNLWIGTQSNGLDRFNLTNREFSHYRHTSDNPHSLSHNSIRALAVDAAGTLWIATFGGGLDHFEKHSGQFGHYRFDSAQPDSLSSDKLTAVSEDHKGNLWIGTIRDGLNYLDVSTGQISGFRHDADAKDSLSNDTIHAITIDHSGNVWVGTDNGLNQINPAMQNDVFEHFMPKDSLGATVVNGMIEDHHGYLWVSSNRGLSRWDPETAVLTGYQASEGVQSNTFVSGAHFISKKGELFFGGNNGFNRFMPLDIIDDSNGPAVVLTDFLLLNQPVGLSWQNNNNGQFALEKTIDATTQLTLGVEQNLVSFEFAALHFSQPKNNRYAYKLDNWDEDWITTDHRHRRATYTNLPAGEYVLRVKAANPQGVWNNQGTRLQVTVLAHPWKTWWAYLLYALLLVGLLYKFVSSQRYHVVNERALNRRFKQVNQLKDEFLAITSYELRTPIHGIIGLAESLIDGVAGKLPHEARRELAMVVASGRRLANQINDIVDFSKLKNRNIELKTRPIELHALCDVVLMLSRPLLGDKTLELVNEVSDELPAALADEVRLQQIIYNLVDNAIKFTDVGRIVVTATDQGEQLKISISDTGVGIETDKLDTIFETFEQIESNSAHTFGGTGLGLSVSKQLVTLHGGTIEVKSSVGWGTTFSFTLPSTKAQAEENLYRQRMIERLRLLELDTEQSQAADVSTSKPNKPFKILLVDDEPVNLQVLHNYLSPLNYELVEATGGQHALYEIAKGEEFDLVLLDLLMPRLSGFEVCKKIRDLYPMNDLPIIFLTANIDVANLVECFKAGGNDYLNKPVNKHELLTRVETHLKLLDINRNLERKVIERTAELESSYQHITALSRICNEISSTLDLDKLLITVYYRIKELMDIKVLCIGHYEPQEQRIVFRQGIESEMYLPEYQDDLSEKNLPSVWCIENKKPVIINDFTRDFAQYFGDLPTPVTKLGEQPKSLVYWPLIVKDRIIGVLAVQSLKKNVFNEHEQDIIRTLASTTAIAVDHAKAYHEIEAQKEAVEQKNTEIIDTQARLLQAEKMASLGTLTAGVAHEINNPTNFVYVGTQNLASDIDNCQRFILDLAGDEADQQVLDSISQKFAPMYEHLKTVTEGTERIMAIVKDLGAFTHLDSADKEPVSLVECLQTTLQLVQSKHGDRIEFVTDFHANPILMGYPGKLNQVFMNLIVNACDAIRDKQRASDQSDGGQVMVGCRQIDKIITVSVHDDGCGMDEQTKNKLFEPFYTTKAVGEGTGLGLSISFGIIEWHGGSIEVESVVGGGSTFTVSFIVD